MSRLGIANLLPSARALAKAGGSTRYIGKVCEKHHEAGGERLTSTGHCFICARDSVKKAQRPGGSQYERARAYSKRHYAENRARLIARQKAATEQRYAIDPQAKQADIDRLQQWNDRNPHAVKERSARWRLENPDKHCAKEGRRRARKLGATPAWANSFFIGEAYSLAKLRERITGGKWHVDHVVPLQSDVVCGLHCEQNLRVIPSTENLVKGNRIWPDMPS